MPWNKVFFFLVHWCHSPSGSQSVSELVVGIKNAAHVYLFFLNQTSGPLQCGLSDKTTVSLFTATPVHAQNFYQILLSDAPHLLYLQVNINPSPPPHLLSYHCPIIIHCLRSTHQDRCQIIENTRVMWKPVRAVYKLQRGYMWHIYRAPVREGGGFTEPLITLQSL